MFKKYFENYGFVLKTVLGAFLRSVFIKDFYNINY